MKKISNWLFRKDLDLNKKLWHRFIKVLFTISIIAIAIYIVLFLIESYERTVNRWNYLQIFSNRLIERGGNSRVLPINQLYDADEIITEKIIFSTDYHPDISNKDLLSPMSGIFLKDYSSQTFCSNKLYENIEKIASSNNIKLFSPVNPSLNRLSDDLSAYKVFLKDNSFSIKCLFINSYSPENKDGEVTKYTFLEPINTYNYVISKYENGFMNFIFLSGISFFGLFLYSIISIFVYHKIVLYVIFGSKK